MEEIYLASDGLAVQIIPDQGSLFFKTAIGQDPKVPYSLGGLVKITARVIAILDDTQRMKLAAIIISSFTL